MSKTKEEKIERTEDLQEILDTPLHSLINIGSSVIAVILLIMFIGCFVFKYPDIITCTITITNTEPPVWIVAKTSGRLQELYVKDESLVSTNDIIAVIENSASTHDVLILDSLLSITTNEEDFLEFNIDDAHLGSIQGTYSALMKVITEYKNFINNNLYDQRIFAEEEMLNTYIDYVKSMAKQIDYSQRINTLNENNYLREKKLHNIGVTSTSNLELTEQNLLNSKLSLEKNKTSLANAQIQIAQIRNTISELRLEKEQEMQQLQNSMKSAIESTKTSISEWKQMFLLRSPITGIVSFSDLWKINQNISTGDNTFSVISKRKECYIGKAKIPIFGSGKVKVGQIINIKLDGYPYLEFGFLTGKITSVSSMPNENAYIATFSLQNWDTTSYGKEIRHTGDLTGVGEIITNDLSLMERIIGPIRYLFYKDL